MTKIAPSTKLASAFERLKQLAGSADCVTERVQIEAEIDAPVRRSKQKSAKVDGRTLRSKGRSVQLNTSVTPAFRTKVNAMAKARGIGLTDLLELAIASLETQEARRA